VLAIAAARAGCASVTAVDVSRRAVAADHQRVAAAELAAMGVRDGPILAKACGPSLEYAALVDAEGFVPLDNLSGRTVLAAAATVGATRLIDNVFLTVEPGGACVADRGTILEDH